MRVKKNEKAMTLRLKKDLWIFIKKKSIDREMSINSLVNDCLDKYKNKCEKKLTLSDTVVS